MLNNYLQYFPITRYFALMREVDSVIKKTSLRRQINYLNSINPDFQLFLSFEEEHNWRKKNNLPPRGSEQYYKRLKELKVEP
jgi:hypothetical protein